MKIFKTVLKFLGVLITPALVIVLIKFNPERVSQCIVGGAIIASIMTVAIFADELVKFNPVRIFVLGIGKEHLKRVLTGTMALLFITLILIVMKSTVPLPDPFPWLTGYVVFGITTLVCLIFLLYATGMIMKKKVTGELQ